ncbi:dihydrofolate reductase [Stackebrandtia albiflava]|uniref:Dihydrofolate reductase n=1 Tax=Stackebrandtia albiflava TaxID=406432 RepID=A0A562VBR7_9ACTN|nr:dihydrofolate reductase family protein [Stackebrandtia albiflava]TWJ15267.1 dihydrofolate reductase [Stackebrandtia albiflava]
MGRLVYSTIGSLDGYAADPDGDFTWAEPTEEVLEFLNETERPVGTYLYGRRMYDMMAYWENAQDEPGLSPASREYTRIWQAADKIVYSTTLDRVTTGATRIERHFDPDLIRRLKAESPRDIGIGGPTIAAEAITAGLVDEYQLYVIPMLVGGGLQILPPGIRISLDLLEERRFSGGTVFLRYRVAS